MSRLSSQRNSTGVLVTNSRQCVCWTRPAPTEVKQRFTSLNVIPLKSRSVALLVIRIEICEKSGPRFLLQARFKSVGVRSPQYSLM